MPLTVAIIGRPNVGKSTLFNRLAGAKLAIVDDAPGVTRDWSLAESNFGGIPLRIIDTAGFDRAAPGTLTARMLAQTNAAISQSDLCLFVVDARDGLTAGDHAVAESLRKSGKPVVLLANKTESAATDANVLEASALGFGDALPISAEHGLGLAELYDALSVHAQDISQQEQPASDEEQDRPLRLAIAGRPNVGKSSLLNRLVGSERSLTSPEPGTTRDAVLAQMRFGDRDILLHDTAGLRKKANVVEKLEKLSTASTLKAIRFADCVILVMDALHALEKQDLAIADLIAQEGRAMVFAANKWDLVQDRGAAMRELRQRVDRLLPQLSGAPIVGLSALTGEGVGGLVPAVFEVDKVWNTRLPTAALNRFLEAALERHPPPAIRGRRIRIRYILQAKARPPTFVLFGTQLSQLPDSWRRYLVNELRKNFGLPGTPIRLLLRSAKNPFVT
jgi:GTP-binding protein